jgi:hypothetical protein
VARFVAAFAVPWPYTAWAPDVVVPHVLLSRSPEIASPLRYFSVRKFSLNQHCEPINTVVYACPSYETDVPQVNADAAALVVNVMVSP